MIHAYKRAFKRDVGNEIKRYKKGEIKITKVLKKFQERVKIPIHDYMKINKFINTILEIKI